MMTSVLQSQSPEYYVGGGSFLVFLIFAARFFWKLVRDGEDLYERRNKSQVEEITRLEVSVGIIRREMEACHKERLALLEDVSTLKAKVATLENKHKN